MTDVWDKTTPLGTEAISLGDDRMRELKSALEAALGHECIFPGASPSTAPIFIPGFLKDTTANRPTSNDLVSKRLFCNTTLNVIERYNGSSWDAVATLIPSGTKMLFYQAAAPTGWTAVAVNDKFLRVVSAGGTGGTSGGSGLTPSSTITLAHSHTVNSHTHSISSDGGHSHTVNSHTHAQSGTITSTSNGAHTHSEPSTGWGTGAAAASGVLLVSDGGGAPGGGNTTTAGSGGNTTGSNGAHTHDTVLSGSTGGATPGTDTQGAHTHSGATGGTAPGTDSQLSNTAFQYADVIVASKD